MSVEKHFKQRIEALEIKRETLLEEQEAEIAKIKAKYQKERREIGSKIGTLKRQKELILDYKKLAELGPLVLTDKEPRYAGHPNAGLPVMQHRLEFGAQAPDNSALRLMLIAFIPENNKVPCSIVLQNMAAGSYAVTEILHKRIELESVSDKEDFLIQGLLAYTQEIEKAKSHLARKGF